MSTCSFQVKVTYLPWYTTTCGNAVDDVVEGIITAGKPNVTSRSLAFLKAACRSHTVEDLISERGLLGIVTLDSNFVELVESIEVLDCILNHSPLRSSEIRIFKKTDESRKNVMFQWVNN
jgi:hypothetical protein